MIETIRTVRAVLRSLRIYYGDRPRRRAMAALYGRFVKPGDVVFDIGAHVGDRVAAFRSLGARVIAVEPQPALARVLRLLYGRDKNVVVAETAVGRAVGDTELMLNIDNPDRLDAVGRFRRGRARQRRLGRAGAGRGACASRSPPSTR